MLDSEVIEVCQRLVEGRLDLLVKYQINDNQYMLPIKDQKLAQMIDDANNEIDNFE